MNCPECEVDVNKDGRCRNVKCKVYSHKVVEIEEPKVLVGEKATLRTKRQRNHVLVDGKIVEIDLATKKYVDSTIASMTMICNDCQGTGKIEKQYINMYSRNYTSIEVEPCKSCSGFGCLTTHQTLLRHS